MRKEPIPVRALMSYLRQNEELFVRRARAAGVKLRRLGMGWKPLEDEDVKKILAVQMPRRRSKLRTDAQ